MKLMLPELMHHLESKPLLIVTPDLPAVMAPNDRVRKLLVRKLMPLLHKAEKFIFDSGSDKDERTVTAVRETAVNMLDAGLFHLPFPITWIEDPFEEKPEQRFFYLCEETDEEIHVHLITSIAPGTVQGRVPYKFMIYSNRAVIEKGKATDQFLIEYVDSMPLAGQTYQEAIYSLKKFIVALNTENIVVDKVAAGNTKAMGKLQRQYAHTIVRVPLDEYQPREGTGTGRSGWHPRKHLVRGYLYGKHTRPKDDQRWIKPYWRGEQEVEVKRSHYKVGN